MRIAEFTTPGSLGVRELAAEIEAQRPKYENLVQHLGSIGTEVEIHRVLETDKDVAPGRFIRHAAHHFIFPPQEVQISKDDSKVLDNTPGYDLYQESRTYPYDETLVRGHLRVNYNDSDNRISFSVSDERDRSELPDSAVELIDKTFGSRAPFEDAV